MKIFVDENIPLMTVRALRGMGYDVRDIRGTADEGMTDDALWKLVQREGRLLISDSRRLCLRLGVGKCRMV
jgi:predicted nuclease of predicted toxin-antitoxin system